jgi:hypothetical protein
MERGVEDIRRVFDGVWVDVRGIRLSSLLGFAWKRWRIKIALPCIGL